MGLAIKPTIYPNIVVLELDGILRFVDFLLRNKVNDLLEMGHREFVLNLSNVSYIDAFGLGQLVSIRNAIHNAGGHMTLLRPTNHIRRLLSVTKLDSVIRILDDVEEPLCLGASSLVSKELRDILNVSCARDDMLRTARR